MKKILTIIALLAAVNLAQAQTWVLTLNGRSVWSLAKDNLGNIYAGGLTNANSRIWRSTNQGSSWDTIYIGSGSTFWGFGFDGSNNIYAANYTAGLLKSTNGGANFTITDISVFGGNQPQNVVCGPGNYVYVATPNGFYRSTNSGANFTGPGLTGLNCLPVVVDKDSANIVYVGVSGGTSGQGFYRSTDFGATFSINLNSGKNGYNLYQKNDGTLYMITTTTPFTFDRSTNKGLTWTTLGNATGAMRGITLDLAGNIYLCGNGGVFKSTNGGTSFANFNLTGSATPIITSGNKILTGITGQGIYVYTDSTITTIDPVNNIVTGYKLEQNYPNPFNPRTIINYQLSMSNNVRLNVYDVNGKLIEVLIDQKQPAGSYSFTFDGSNFASGVYYYKLEAEGYSEVRKMLLMK